MNSTLSLTPRPVAVKSERPKPETVLTVSLLMKLLSQEINNESSIRRWKRGEGKLLKQFWGLGAQVSPRRVAVLMRGHPAHPSEGCYKLPFLPPLLLLLTALFVATAAAQTDQRPPAKAQSTAPAIEQAQAMLGAGNADAAIGLLSSIPKSESDELMVNHLLGLAFYQKGVYARAVEHLSIAVKKGQEDSRLYKQGVHYLGMSHYFLGQAREAIPYLEKVRNSAPENSEVAYVLGICYIRTQNPDASREAFARLFAVPSRSPSAYLMNAQMMIRQQVEALAEKELQKALDLDPKLPQANFLLGEMAIYRAEVETGIELLKKEIAINPAFAMAYYRLGEAYTRQQKWDEAIAPLQKSIWLNPYFSGPFIVLGKVYLKKGDLANAEGMLRRALQMDPNNFSGHYTLAQVLQKSNRVEEAKKEFELADRLRTESDK